MSQRQEKVAQAIKEEISTIIHDEIRDPRVGFVTITQVKLTADLRFARIFYSVMGDDEQKSKAQEGLDSAVKYLRKLLGDKMKLRYAPDITFEFDDTLHERIRLDELFDKIEKERVEGSE